jgi:type IV pilus assembly protein PilW
MNVAHVSGHRSRGAGLVEVLVGVTIALLTVHVIHRVFVASETLRRDMQAAGDAQQTGLFVMSRLALEIANAGAGIAPSTNRFATCPASGDIATTLRPIGAMITDGGSDDTPDSLVVRYGAAAAAVTAMPFAAAAPAGTPFSVAAVHGIAPGDRVVAISGRGECVAAVVTDVRVPSPGVLEVGHGAVTVDLSESATLINLGGAGRALALRFDVAGGVLRTTDIANGDAPNPLASNIVNLKFQYGIDTDGDGALDTWVAARNAGAHGSWTPTAMLGAGVDTLSRVRAIRVGVIVRSEFQDRALRDGFRWVMFDCASADKANCPGRLTGTVAATAGGGWRHRVYEAVVPLRNPLRGG